MKRVITPLPIHGLTSTLFVEIKEEIERDFAEKIGITNFEEGETTDLVRVKIPHIFQMNWEEISPMQKLEEYEHGILEANPSIIDKINIGLPIEILKS